MPSLWPLTGSQGTRPVRSKSMASTGFLLCRLVEDGLEPKGSHSAEADTLTTRFPPLCSCRPIPSILSQELSQARHGCPALQAASTGMRNAGCVGAIFGRRAHGRKVTSHEHRATQVPLPPFAPSARRVVARLPGPQESFEDWVTMPSPAGPADMWGGNSRVVALFPADWDLTGVMGTVQEVSNGSPALKRAALSRASLGQGSRAGCLRVNSPTGIVTSNSFNRSRVTGERCLRRFRRRERDAALRRGVRCSCPSLPCPSYAACCP